MSDHAPTPHPAVTILVVDDEKHVLEMMRRVLASRGYRVLTADAGANAAGLLATESIDVLITDLCMPGLSGVDLLTAARNDHPRVARIAYSGANDFLLAKRCVNDGEVHRYLTKPCCVDEILSAVHGALHAIRAMHSGACRRHEDEGDRSDYVLSRQRLEKLRRSFAGTELEALAELASPVGVTFEATTVDAPFAASALQEEEG